MAFGQQSGRPANGRQVKDLEELLARSGYTSFRDARGPLGLTQRQGGGKFTDDEATELVARLERELEAADPETDGPTPSSALAAPRARGAKPAAPTPAKAPKAAVEEPVADGGLSRRDQDRALMLRRMPEALLAGELERRGWVVIPPA